MATLFVGYPSAVIYKLENENINQPPETLVAIKQLLWGDYLSVLAESLDGKFYSVFVRGEKGWIHKSDTQQTDDPKERVILQANQSKFD